MEKPDFEYHRISSPPSKMQGTQNPPEKGVGQNVYTIGVGQKGSRRLMRESSGALARLRRTVVVQLLSRVQLFCDPIDYSPSGSSVHGVPQERILKWVAISFSRRST